MSVGNASKGRAPTVSADIYGLGALLRALTVGVPPDGTLQPNNTNVPPAISAICARCLAADPDKRYQTVAHFIQDLNTQCAS